jgi:hypothetical protein
MTDESDSEKKADLTSPPGGKTHEATTPPGSGERDEDSIKKGEDGLEQAGGGH